MVSSDDWQEDDSGVGGMGYKAEGVDGGWRE